MQRLSPARCVLSFACLFLLLGCTAPHQTTMRPAMASAFGTEAGLSPQEEAWVAQLCPLGTPKHLAGANLGNTKILARQGYVLEESFNDKIPLWVCENVSKAEVSGPLGRPAHEPFAPDPELLGMSRAELADYKNSGYDRGHQAPSGDETVKQDLQNQTYYLSNMCPQTKALNEGIWKGLETQVRDLAKSHGPVLVITGPMFYDPNEDNAHTADGLVPVDTIGKGVAVPTHCYKVVLWKDDQGKWEGTGFVIPNQQAKFPSPYNLKQYIQPIEWIQTHTGLNFEPNLSGADATRVENSAGQLWN